MVLRETRWTDAEIVVVIVGVIPVSAGQCEAVIIVHLLLISHMILSRQKAGKPSGSDGCECVCVCGGGGVAVFQEYFFNRKHIQDVLRNSHALDWLTGLMPSPLFPVEHATLRNLHKAIGQ
jgi:hypothetical protein